VSTEVVAMPAKGERMSGKSFTNVRKICDRRAEVCSACSWDINETSGKKIHVLLKCSHSVTGYFKDASFWTDLEHVRCGVK
jgi:hypothetical protein